MEGCLENVGSLDGGGWWLEGGSMMMPRGALKWCSETEGDERIESIVHQAALLCSKNRLLCIILFLLCLLGPVRFVAVGRLLVPPM